MCIDTRASQKKNNRKTKTKCFSIRFTEQQRMFSRKNINDSHPDIFIRTVQYTHHPKTNVTKIRTKSIRMAANLTIHTFYECVYDDVCLVVRCAAITNQNIFKSIFHLV